MDNTKELMIKVLEIKVKYGEAAKPKKIEVGEVMTGKRIFKYKRKRKNKR